MKSSDKLAGKLLQNVFLSQRLLILPEIFFGNKDSRQRSMSNWLFQYYLGYRPWENALFTRFRRHGIFLLQPVFINWPKFVVNIVFSEMIPDKILAWARLSTRWIWHRRVSKLFLTEMMDQTDYPFNLNWPTWIGLIRDTEVLFWGIWISFAEILISEKCWKSK